MTSCVYHMTSCVYHMTSCVYHMTSCVYHMTNCVYHMTSCVYHMTSCVYHSLLQSLGESEMKSSESWANLRHFENDNWKTPIWKMDNCKI